MEEMSFFTSDLILACGERKKNQRAKTAAEAAMTTADATKRDIVMFSRGLPAAPSVFSVCGFMYEIYPLKRIYHRRGRKEEKGRLARMGDAGADLGAQAGSSSQVLSRSAAGVRYNMQLWRL